MAKVYNLCYNRLLAFHHPARIVPTGATLKSVFSFGLGALVLVILALPATGARIAIETFDTRTHADTVATTADWDTTAGRLRMPSYLRVLGQVPTTDWALSVTVAGDYAYVSADADGLFVFDVSDPASPVLEDVVVTTEQIVEVVIRGDYAYFANVFAGLYIFDVSDPAHPVYVSDRITNGQTLGVDVAGNYAYLADGPRGLRVIDVSDPYLPVQVGSFTPPGQGLMVRVAGRYAYLASWIEGLSVIDITDPTNPVEVARLDTPGISRGLAVQGNRLYWADGTPGLHVIDISDPLEPAFVNTVPTVFARGVATAGPFLYVADGSGGLRSYDISSPFSPLLLARASEMQNCHWPVVRGGFGFAADGDGGLHSLRLAEPVDTLRSEFEVGVPGSAGAVAFDGLDAWVGTASGMTAVDIADPASPVPLGSYPTTGAVLDADIDGDILLLGADAAPTLEFVDITTPSAPTSHATVSTAAGCAGVALDGGLAYAACGGWIYVIDASDLAAPVAAGSLAVGGAAADVHVDGRWLYVADATAAGFAVADVSDPSLPALHGTFVTSGAAATGIDVDGDLACLGLSDGTLVTVDVTDPSAPSELGRVAVGGTLRSVVIEGDRVLAAGSAGLLLFDITDPAAPVMTAGTPTAGDAVNAVAWGDHALVVNANAGLEGIRHLRRRAAPGQARGQSLSLHDGDDILRGRVLAQGVGDGAWSLSADGGATWTRVAPDNTWTMLAPGPDLRWRVDLEYGPEATEVDDVTVEWLTAASAMCFVSDIPDDQGGSVQVGWSRSAHDFADAADPVAEYVVQRLDPAAASWDSVRVVPAAQAAIYVTIIPSAGDVSGADTTWTRVRVLTRSSGGALWVSAPDSGYSTDNLAPAPPQNLEVAYNGAGNHLAWDPPPDPDVAGYRVYRDVVPMSGPDPQRLVHETVNTFWSDAVADGVQYTYIVTAVDSAPNESGAASPTTVSSANPGPGPARFALLPNVPNPFNPETVIPFEVPAPVRVSVRVFDVRGRLVRTLHDGRVPAGAGSVRWDGRDGRGQPVASGVYFVRMTARGFSATRKVTLIE